MRKIRKVIAESIIKYYDSDGVEQTFHTNGNVRNVEMAIKVLMDAGIVNILVDDITVIKNTYVMDVDTFLEYAERVVTDLIDNDTDNDNGNDTDNDNDNDNDKDIEF